MAFAVCQIPFIAAETSILAAATGVPFGGTAAWTLAFIMTDNSGELPYTPLVAAALGWPVTLVCDIVLFVPSIVAWTTMYFRQA